MDVVGPSILVYHVTVKKASDGFSLAILLAVSGDQFGKGHRVQVMNTDRFCLPNRLDLTT